ncbi:MAG: hypothetical protein JRF72_22675 [Deltaproteobacteria bacterium]|jgi:hypothetical protein|nr:hypothetical protein [Deltaproteobacteria bacterium]
MYGFENIATHNGWAMAAAGALIVLSGLTVLSFVISQLHRFVKLLETRKKSPQHIRERFKAEATVDRPKFVAPERFPEDLRETATLYKSLAEQLGPAFPLSELYTISNKHGLPHPHLTIKSLREAQILVPVGGGNFSWKQETMAS